jgi:hypothetical protein
MSLARPCDCSFSEGPGGTSPNATGRYSRSCARTWSRSTWMPSDVAPRSPAHPPAMGVATPTGGWAHQQADRPPPRHFRGNRADSPGKHLRKAPGFQPHRRRHPRLPRPGCVGSWPTPSSSIGSDPRRVGAGSRVGIAGCSARETDNGAEEGSSRAVPACVTLEADLICDPWKRVARRAPGGAAKTEPSAYAGPAVPRSGAALTQYGSIRQRTNRPTDQPTNQGSSSGSDLARGLG